MSDRSPIETLSQQRRQRLKRADVDRARRPKSGDDADSRHGADASTLFDTGGSARLDTGESAGLDTGDSARLASLAITGVSVHPGAGIDDGGGSVPRMGMLIDGRFRLLGRLGSGRLGEIYEARVERGPDAGLERLVALQLLDHELGMNHALTDRLRRGYAALRAGPHPNIVTLEDMGRDGSIWYFVMERLEGVSLRFVIDDGGPLPSDEVTAVVRSVGDALSYLHAKGMIHGSVTPASVFVTEAYEVKLLDIVSALPPISLPAVGETQTGATTREPDQSDDVYSLACLTYELLTGRHPYNYATAAEARRLRLAPGVIGEMPRVRWQALARGLDPEPGRRPSNVGVFLRDLGISGSERLTAPEQPPQTARAAPSSYSAATRDTSPFVATAEDRLDVTPLPRRPGRGRWLRRALFVAVLAGFGAAAWVYREPIAEVASERLVTAALDFLSGRAECGDAAPRAAAAASAAAVNDAGPESAATPGAAEPAAITSSQGSAAASRVEAAPEPSAAPPEVSAAERESTPEPAVGTAAAGLDPSAASPVAEGPERLVLARTVRGREGFGPVAVPVRREGDASSATVIVWWTSDETALAGEDYADFGERSEQIAAGERDLILHVPLVDDALPEPRESFLVNLGRRDPGSGSIDLIATTRVEIDDDDNSRR